VAGKGSDLRLLLVRTFTACRITCFITSCDPPWVSSVNSAVYKRFTYSRHRTRWTDL